MNANELRIMALDRAIQMVGCQPGPEPVRLAAILKAAVGIEDYISNGRIEGFLDSLPGLFDEGNLILPVSPEGGKIGGGIVFCSGNRDSQLPDQSLTGKGFVGHKESPSVCVTSGRVDDTDAGVTASASDKVAEEKPYARLTVGGSFPLLIVLIGHGHASSFGEARRLIRRGRIKFNGAILKDEAAMVSPADDAVILL